jgi:hypothetical protein
MRRHENSEAKAITTQQTATRFPPVEQAMPASIESKLAEVLSGWYTVGLAPELIVAVLDGNNGDHVAAGSFGTAQHASPGTV